jgi:hypothetical protein
MAKTNQLGTKSAPDELNAPEGPGGPKEQLWQGGGGVQIKIRTPNAGLVWS